MTRFTTAALVWTVAAMAVVTAGGGAEPATALRPDELGRVMILVYHQIGEPEARWTRTPAHLRDDLERLWRGGYRTVALADLVDGRVDVPAGTSPVVLTFDDSSPGQFRYVERDGAAAIDPDCAVAILEDFARTHPGFGHKATFYVLPGAAQPHRLFGQPGYERRKLEYLVQHGFEIGNHTFWHADLSRYPEPVVRSQLARAQAAVATLIRGYQLRTLALPMGAPPRQLDWAIRGSAGGITYRHAAIVRVTGGPAPSPFSRTFDPFRLPRIQATDSELRSWLRHFDDHPEARFVSDGDPDTVTVRAGRRAELREPLPQHVRVDGGD